MMSISDADLAALPDDGAIVILTGSGISRESGIHTFRDADGIWAQVNIEDVATPQAFARNPARVHDFYNTRRAGLKDSAIQPNAAHKALAALEADWPGQVLVVTQNVDNLHERGGSENLLHMHGQLDRIRCINCAAEATWLDDLSVTTVCAQCGQAGGLRPAIVWFGEIPLHMEQIEQALSDCALFIAIGTSGEVYPAGAFVSAANRAGAMTIEINTDITARSLNFDAMIKGKATAQVPALVQRLLASRI